MVKVGVDTGRDAYPHTRAGSSRTRRPWLDLGTLPTQVVTPVSQPPYLQLPTR
jgi:hypothetical protein